MTRTVADASRDYRKRRADRLARHREAAERFEIAYCEVIETANKQCREGIISYVELKTAVNTAAYLRNALNPVTAGGDE